MWQTPFMITITTVAERAFGYTPKEKNNSKTPEKETWR
jgi:hypothetical protein